MHFFLSSALLLATAFIAFPSSLGPLYENFSLTLQTGKVIEALGPIVGKEEYGSGRSLFRLSPLFSLYEDTKIPQREFELLYPLLTYDHFGPEYRFQLMQVLSWSGGKSSKTGDKSRFTLFPLYFQQRSTNQADNYTALVPFYGRLQNRLFRDEVHFVMLPLYLRTEKRGVVTHNMPFPLFHIRTGPGLKGWQFWPLIGWEEKLPGRATNIWKEEVTIPGHKRFSLLWPFYFKNTLGIGTTNVQEQFVLLPFYTSISSPARDSRSYGFPLGYTHTIDRQRGYEEHDLPWPLVVFARGEGKQVNRVWPFFSQAKGPILQSDFYLWPIYKYNRATAAPLDRERTRILLFLYSDLVERNTATGTEFRRRDLWPLYTWRKERDDSRRLQLFAPLEPILPHNKSVERLYSPIYSVWRSEKNGKTGHCSRSLLWNFVRAEQRQGERNFSALFGVVQYRRNEDGRHLRICFIPFTMSKKD
jgi:hypothetical protein